MSDRKRDILISSIKLAASNGVGSITIKNISKEIGVSEPALYRHFKSKKEIILGILYFFKEITEVEIKSDAVNYTSADKLKYILQKRIEEFEIFPEMAYLMLCFDIFMRDEELRTVALKVINAHKKQIISIISEGQTSGEIRNDSAPSELFMLVIGPFRLLLTQWFLTNYSFDLKAEFNVLWKAIHKIINNL